jgi:5'(3')-deoxyribonucleotidase
MDGILADLSTRWIARYNADWDDTLDPARVTSRALHHWVRPECGTQVYRYLHDPDLFLSLDPYPGAVETVRSFIGDLGLDVMIVTSAPPGVHQAKAAWMKRHFPFVKQPEQIIFAARKEWVEADIFIDDGPENLARYLARRPLAAVGTLSHPYNARVPAVVMRAETWDDLGAWVKWQVRQARGEDGS